MSHTYQQDKHDNKSISSEKTTNNTNEYENRNKNLIDKHNSSGKCKH